MSKPEVGVSTASLFKRKFNEESVSYLSERNVPVCEIFLGTYREYKPAFAELLNANKGNMRVHSVHTLNTHFEPQLFSANPRALEDAYEIAEDVLRSAKILGAKYYTFHGVARVKRKITYNDYAAIGRMYSALCDKCGEYGVQLALENVEWAHYNHVGFFSGVKEFCPKLKGTLDIKQAREAGEDYDAYLNEMGENIVTVHVSDADANGNLCLPGRGTVNFTELFKKLSGVGFCGAVLIEVYNENYGETEDIIASYEYLKNSAEKVFR